MNKNLISIYFQIFLRCVAESLELWIKEQPIKENMMKYVEVLTRKTDNIGEVIDECIETDITDDFSDHIYNVYQCFWRKVSTTRPNPDE